jgi:multidrug efflux pump subunit AcrA (membrane-fusion protein)
MERRRPRRRIRCSSVRRHAHLTVSQLPPGRDIPTTQAERRGIREEIRLSSDVAPAFQVEIKPEVGGKLREVHGETRQQVKEGELLFVMDDSDLQIERASVQVQIDGARVSVEKLAGTSAAPAESSKPS